MLPPMIVCFLLSPHREREVKREQAQDTHGYYTFSHATNVTTKEKNIIQAIAICSMTRVKFVQGEEDLGGLWAAAGGTVFHGQRRFTSCFFFVERSYSTVQCSYPARLRLQQSIHCAGAPGVYHHPWLHLYVTRPWSIVCEVGTLTARQPLVVPGVQLISPFPTER